VGFRFVNQLHMAIVQVAHGRHQRNALALTAQSADVLAQQRQGFNNQHA